MLSPDEIEFYARTFHPYAHAKMRRLKDKNLSLVHYTSALVAMSIIEKEEIWMRKTTMMNDFQEVQHGLKMLNIAWNNRTGEDLRKAIDNISPDACAKIVHLFEGWEGDFVEGTYVTCFSEHPRREDALGRLSMWRAYGRPAGVALVCNTAPFQSQSNALKVYSSPVAYLSQDDFELEMRKLTRNLNESAHDVRRLGEEVLVRGVFNALRFAVLCTKHEGFLEENEWRVVHTPGLDGSDKLRRSVKDVGGIPQIVYMIPLMDHPDEGFVGATIGSLIERIIVGPTDFAVEIQEAFIELLERKDVPDPSSKVVISGIPLR